MFVDTSRGLGVYYDTMCEGFWVDGGRESEKDRIERIKRAFKEYPRANYS